MSQLGDAEAWLSALTDDDVRALARTIDEDGIVCVPGFLSSDDLARMRGFVAAALVAGGQQSVSLGGGEVGGSGLDTLADSASFKALFARLYAIGLQRPAPEVRFYQVLRCLTGSSIARHSWLFHYDSYAITALLPLEIPTSGQRGDFLLLPNTRRIRATYLANLLDKLLLDNPLAQRLLRRRSAGPGIKRVAMVPGNLYLFWGYRTIHTNAPVDAQAVRATALYHYADPHADSRLKRRLGRGGRSPYPQTPLPQAAAAAIDDAPVAVG
jgi:hypothetical protein